MKKQSSAQKSNQASSKARAQQVPVESERVVGEGAELHLELPGFEGPFDLLLHLIEEHELDILNIPVAFVTERYLQYLALMQELNIDIAADYLVMAATLAHIKSRMLLPTPPADDDADGDEAEQDPRAELIRRLLEYQKYKQAAEQLANRSVLGRDTFARGALPEIVEGPAPLAPVGIWKLLEAFEKILSRAKTSLDHHIEFERLSITDRINQLVDLLKAKGRLSFDDLFDGQCSRAELIVTFLALLEMTKLRLTNVQQESALAPIYIELAVSELDADSLTSELMGDAVDAVQSALQGEPSPSAVEHDSTNEAAELVADPAPLEDAPDHATLEPTSSSDGSDAVAEFSEATGEEQPELSTEGDVVPELDALGSIDDSADATTVASGETQEPSAQRKEDVDSDKGWE